ncbi:phosphatase PAP2 family protein [Novosphingobium sp. PhB165]|uniref:phosphatase PAP2 family protein n=1 Tax=Novosphingobium sp. PhB165 TaxID=2485105 RepID=UPI001FB38288|nr:phosphatase PAP2 family protein [Novosphingobium sp. PhB165]
MADELVTPALAAVREAGPSITRHFLTALLLSLFALSALMHAAGLHIDPWRAGNLPYYAAGAVLLSLRFGLPRTAWRHAVPVARFCEYAGLFTLISLMGATASYPVAALTHGYADVALQRVDEALGFNWLGWYRTVAAHPVLQLLGTAAYRSIYVTPALLLWAKARAGQHAEAYRFIAGFWLAAVITLAVFSLMPAVGPFSHLWHGAIPYMPESELWQSGLIPALRAHSVHIVDLAKLRGIVSAPSFHTAAAVLYIVAAWRMPSMRWPIVALNVAMLLSTPVEGTHYLIDMLLGAVVAVVSLALIGFYERMQFAMARRDRAGAPTSVAAAG